MWAKISTPRPPDDAPPGTILISGAPLFVRTYNPEISEYVSIENEDRYVASRDWILHVTDQPLSVGDTVVMVGTYRDEPTVVIVKPARVVRLGSSRIDGNLAYRETWSVIDEEVLPDVESQVSKEDLPSLVWTVIEGLAMHDHPASTEQRAVLSSYFGCPL